MRDPDVFYQKPLPFNQHYLADPSGQIICVNTGKPLRTTTMIEEDDPLAPCVILDEPGCVNLSASYWSVARCLLMTYRPFRWMWISSYFDPYYVNGDPSDLRIENLRWVNPMSGHVVENGHVPLSNWIEICISAFLLRWL